VESGRIHQIAKEAGKSRHRFRWTGKRRIMSVYRVGCRDWWGKSHKREREYRSGEEDEGQNPRRPSKPNVGFELAECEGEDYRTCMLSISVAYLAPLSGKADNLTYTTP